MAYSGIAAALLVAAALQADQPMLAGGEGDPIALARSAIGMDDAAYKRAVPGKHGVLFDPACPGQLTTAHKDGRVSRAILWAHGAGCATLAETALRKQYGEPAAGGYGYATALANSKTYHRVNALKWCEPDLDIILVSMSAQANVFNIFISKPGQYDPGSGKTVDPSSQEYRDSCRPGAH